MVHASTSFGVFYGLIGCVVFFGLPSTKMNTSTWVVEIDSESPPVTQTWYVDTKNGKIKIVEDDSFGTEALRVQEFHKGHSYEYSIWNSNLEMQTICNSKYDTFLCHEWLTRPNELDTTLQGELENKGETKMDCRVDPWEIPIIDATKIKRNGNFIDLAGFKIKMDSKTPVAIFGEGVQIATITSVVSGIPESVSFEGCSETSVDVDVVGDDFKQIRNIQSVLFGASWCGSDTDMVKTKCPFDLGNEDAGDNMACRKHHHGRITNPVAGGLGMQFECEVDKNLSDESDNWAVQAVFGVWGVSQIWGCKHYRPRDIQYWGWCNGGWGSYPCRKTRTMNWETKFGPNRYSGLGERNQDQLYSSNRTKMCMSDSW